MLSIGAVTAAPASAFQEHTACEILVYNYTPYTMRVYDSAVNGSHGSLPQSITAGGVGTFDADSWFPIHNHCSIDLQWELQTPDGSGWSQSMETYVYDPNSGRNNAWASMNGDFAQRTTGTNIEGGPFWGVQDEDSIEVLSADACAPTCPPPYSARSRAASRPSSPGLRAGVDPLRSTPDAATGVQEPKQVPSLLQRRDLIGRGWRRVTRIEDLGRLGRILAAAKVPAACQDKHKDSEPWPLREGLSAFARDSGAEFIGAGQAVYAHAGQARRTIRDAMSVHSIGCLARMFTSKRFHIRVNTQRRSVTFAGRKLILNRLTIRTRPGARITRTAYIDVIGALHANANALLMFASNKRPPEFLGEVTAINAVVGRLP